MLHWILKEEQIGLTQNIGDLVAKEMGALGGGGQAFFGTAGGKNPSGLKNAIKEVIEKL